MADVILDSNITNMGPNSQFLSNKLQSSINSALRLNLVLLQQDGPSELIDALTIF